MKPLRPIALSLALALGGAAGDVAVPMKDGTVLRGERVEAPELSGRGLRIRTGGVTVFVPWEEVAEHAVESLKSGRGPAIPSPNPPVAPGPGEAPEADAAEPGDFVEGVGPALPETWDPRF